MVENEKKVEDIEIHSSVLGTKQYWDDLYQKEIDQFKSNSELQGEIWFGENVQQKVLSYILSNFDNTSSVIDLGCGNCEFLIGLHQEGFTKLVGLDYSLQSLKFTQEKLNKKGIDGVIELIEADLNSTISENLKEKNYLIIHDKGTFDAFMLHEQNDYKNYLNFVLNLTNIKSTFIITSCNFNKDELLTFFNNEKIKLIKELEYKKFGFGGSTGQLVTTLVMSVN